MTTFTDFKAAVDRFLSDSEPAVLSIKGHWGVGKTYTWSKYLRELQVRSNEFKGIYQRNYAYCSLFGQQSIADVKGTLFGSLKPIFEKEGKSKSWFKKRGKGLLEGLDGAGIPLLGSIQGTDQLAKLILEKSIKNLVICFDDLDRKEPVLTDSAFLGLVTGLRDLKNCKVVLLYNDDVVENEEDSNVVFKSFMEYREKVVDHEFAFRPTPNECFEIAFKGNKLGISLNASDERSQAVAAALRPLRLNNIRILKKVKNALEYFTDILLETYPQALSNNYGQIVKLCAIYYRHGSELKLKDILSYTPYRLALANKKIEEDPKEKRLLELLKSYDYHHVEFDSLIEDYLRDGYIDTAKYQQLLGDIEKRQDYSELQSEHSKHWHALYDNFLVSGEDFIREHQAFLEQHYDEVDIFSMEAALHAINAVGGDINVFGFMDKRLREVIKGVSSLEIIRNDARRSSKELLEYCDKVYWEVRQPLPIDEVISKMTKDGGWNPADSIDLEPLSEDDFHEYFTSTDDPDLTTKIKELRSRLLHNNPNGKEILNKVDSALRKIAERSAIDALRVRNYIGKGILTKPDGEQPAEDEA
tara:strand:+ start:687 stop:2441 length:1755 start_codon:yes stop_codon:yes gene_type:complete